MTESTTIVRSITIDALPHEIAPHIADLHRWVDWSPWEGQDPELKRTYTGTPGSVGSTYEWNGNRKAGAGTMTITRALPTEVDVDLRFTAPFKSTSTVDFRLVETGSSTQVVWTMTSPQNLMARVMRIFINMEKLIGTDFEKGLTKLKTVVESA
jgi:hypothetical protein